MIKVQLQLNVSRYKSHKTLHNTKSWNNKHVLLHSFSPLCIAVRFDTHAACPLILITRLYWFWTTRNEPYRKIFYTAPNLPFAECVVLPTLSRDQLTRVIKLEKFLYSLKVLETSLLLALYWFFSSGLNTKHLKVSCLICITKYINAIIIVMGSHNTYQWTRFAGKICILNLFNITPSLQPFSSCALLNSENYFTN
jgi:hypothetical protein